MPPQDILLEFPAGRLAVPHRLGLYVYSAALVVTACAIVVALVAHEITPGPPVSLAVLAGMALLAERQSIRLSGTQQLSVAFLPIVFSAVAFGPLAAMVVGAGSLLGDFGTPHLRWVIWTSSRAITGAVAGLVALTLTSAGVDNFGLLVAAVAAAVTTEAGLDLMLGVVTLMLRGTGSLKAASRPVGPILLASVPLYTPVIAVLIYAYQALSAWAILIFFMPALAAQRLFMLYREQRETAQELAIANSRLERANLSFATALVATLDARDEYTSGHSAAVAVYARDIAIQLGCSIAKQRLAEVCGLVHDIGKIGLPPGLLEKADLLTQNERLAMERHSEIGERILANVEDYAEIALIVRHHHERIDGQGYPDRLTGDAIPMTSRIVAVADAYDAMTSDRAYRGAMSPEVARLRLIQASGTQFDASVVAAFDAVLTAAAPTYCLGTRLRALENIRAEPSVATVG